MARRSTAARWSPRLSYTDTYGQRRHDVLLHRQGGQRRPAAASPPARSIALTYPAAPTGLSATAGLGHADQPELVRLQRRHQLQRLSRHEPRRRELRSPIYSGSNTSYSDTGLSSGTTYYYTVKAINASGSSVASNEANALTYPAPPTLSATAVSATTNISLTWSGQTGTGIGYNVYRGTTSGGENYGFNGGTLVVHDDLTPTRRPAAARRITTRSRRSTAPAAASPRPKPTP